MCSLKKYCRLQRALLNFLQLFHFTGKKKLFYRENILILMDVDIFEFWMSFFNVLKRLCGKPSMVVHLTVFLCKLEIVLYTHFLLSCPTKLTGLYRTVSTLALCYTEFTLLIWTKMVCRLISKLHKYSYIYTSVSKPDNRILYFLGK